MLPAVHPVRDSAANADAAALRTPLAALLSGHVLQDGELVMLLLKPSRWFIVLTSLWFIAFAAILAIAGWKLWPHLFGSPTLWGQLWVLAAAGRVGFAVLQWMGRFYILTDLRVLQLGGIFQVEVFDCPLRRIERTRLIRPFRERLVARGSIEFLPFDPERPRGLWQTLRKPEDVLQLVDDAIARAKAGGKGGDVG
jgi:hypothetical protein